MKKLIFLLIISIPLSLSCRPQGNWWAEEFKNMTDNHFAPGDTWGGWNPPEENEELKEWIKQWMKRRSTDRPESDEWGSERGPGSGWPQHWRGLGLGLDGVAAPPWAYVPGSYDKPQYCFHLPRFGHCSENLTRWGFNPTTQKCQTFFYSGCGGSENNFMNMARCEAACVNIAAPDCEDKPAVNFEEMITSE